MRFLSIICSLLFPVLLFAQRQPNIIYIYADDLGAGEIGCYGQEKIKTPGSKWELYNLETDPQEKINLANSYPKILSTINQIVRKEHRPSDIPAWNFIDLKYFR